MSEGSNSSDTTRRASGPTPPGPGATLADRIDYLFSMVHPRGRDEFTLEEVTAGMRERTGVSITTAYLSQLRKGQRTNPSRDVLAGLADFFGVNPSYFFDEEAVEQVAAELELYTVMRDAEVREIALRLPDLSPQGLRAIGGIIEHFRQVEGQQRRGTPSQGEAATEVASPEETLDSRPAPPQKSRRATDEQAEQE